MGRTVGMGNHIGAADDASGVAGVPYLPATGLGPFVDGLAADLAGALKTALAEVPGGEPTGLVHDVDENGGAEGRKGLTGYGVVFQGVCQGLAALVEELLVGDLESRRF